MKLTMQREERQKKALKTGLAFVKRCKQKSLGGSMCARGWEVWVCGEEVRVGDRMSQGALWGWIRGSLLYGHWRAKMSGFRGESLGVLCRGQR